MSRAEKTLVVLLRLSALLLLLAVFPIVFPHAWMAAIHRWLGLGELPDLPIVGYLTRSLSALYASHGALVLYVSLDVRRYLPVVRCLMVISIVFGAVMIMLDQAVDMPLWWAVGEGPLIMALAAVLLWLSGRVDPTSPTGRGVV